MKYLTRILTLCLALFALPVFGQGTQQRVINTTSAFAREILTNETAAEWAAQILLGTNFNFGNFGLLNGTNTWTGTNTFSSALSATNSTNIFGGDGLALLIAASKIQAGTISNAISATNVANNFVGTFTGNGAGLTNVSGGGGGAPSGPAGGDLANTYPNPQVATVGGVAAASVATGANLANAATSLNTAGTIVKRDGSGNFSAGTISGVNFFGNGAGLSNVPVSSSLVNLANWTGKLGTFISNVPPAAVNDPVINGLVSAKAGQNLWTNNLGSWTWHNTNSGLDVPMHMGDFLIASNGSGFVDQHRIMYFPSAGVAFTYEASTANYAAPGVNAVVNPNYLSINDTIPRPTAFIADDGGIGVMGFGAVAGVVENSGAFYVGNKTNWWGMHDYNDTSGYGWVLESSYVGSGVIVEVYTNALNHSLNVRADGKVEAQYGMVTSSSVATNSVTTGNLTVNSNAVIATGNVATANIGTLNLTNTISGTNITANTLQANSFSFGTLAAQSALTNFMPPLGSNVFYKITATNDVCVVAITNGPGSVSIRIAGNGTTARFILIPDSIPVLSTNGATHTGTNLIWTLPQGSNIAWLSFAADTSNPVLSNVTASVIISGSASGGGGGSGTVTSAGFTGDGTVFNSSVTGSPITTSGTFAPSLVNQAANTVFAGPTSGGAATPTWQTAPTISAANMTSFPAFTNAVNALTNDTRALNLTNAANTLSGVGSGLTGLNIAQTNIASGSPIPNIIWDDDFNPDVDMVPSMTMLYNAVNAGACNLLAVTCDSSGLAARSGVANAAVVGQFYGISTLYGSTTNTLSFAGSDDPFLTSTFPSGIPSNVTSNSENAVTLWRRVMANSPQHSIRLVVTGQGYNLDDFLKSPADNISQQTGFQLMSNKVELISVFAGDYTNGFEFNLTSSTNSIAWVTNYPITVPVYWAGNTLGSSVKTFASSWLTQLQTNNPAYMYATNKIAAAGRECWDQLSIALAVYGTNIGGVNVFSLYQGTNTLTFSGATKGSNYWVFGTGTNFNQFFLSNACPTITLSNILFSLCVNGQPNIINHALGYTTAKQISITDTNSGLGANPFSVINSSASTFSFPVQISAPNLPANGMVGIAIAKVPFQSKDAGYLRWTNSSSGSSANGLIMMIESGSGYFKFNGLGVSESKNGFSSLSSNLLAPTAITFPATTVNWTNTQTVNIVVYIDNTAVTGTSIKQNGTTIFSGLSADVTLMLQPNETFSETYTVGTPSATWKPF